MWAWNVRVSASSPEGMIVKSIAGATLLTITDASDVSVRLPSLTSTRAFPVQSSPHRWAAGGSGDHAVSHVPSTSKSQRNVSGFPSGSDEAPALNVIDVPSEPT